MSDHAIENLVEHSVRLVLASPMEAAARRDLIGELYVFQDLYDTSDTRGRLASELAVIGYADNARDRTRPRHWPETLIADGTLRYSVMVLTSVVDDVENAPALSNRRSALLAYDLAVQDVVRRVAEEQ